MTRKWFKIENIKGIRYYEHNTRIYKKRKDRNFVLQYKVDGKVKNEALGWESDGWTTEKAVSILQEIKQNQKNGKGSQTLSEKREEALKKIKTEEQEKILTFSAIFEKYLDQAKNDKSEKSCKNELGMFKTWIFPVIGDKILSEITLDSLEEIKKSITNAKRTPRTALYVLAVIRQVFNYAKSRDLYYGDNPVNKVKKPSRDNRRNRFLTKQEAETLLNHLKESSGQLHDMALISLRCGLRAGEIFTLTWNNIDFEHEILTAMDTKTKKNKNVIMTKDVIKILENRAKNYDSNGLIFVSANGTKINEISNTFSRIIEKLGFNDGITDDRQKVVFHTLRHTYASWLVMSGVDLYTVQRLMGHSTISMTERYSHLAPDHLKKAVGMLEAKFAW